MTVQELLSNISSTKINIAENNARVDLWESWYRGYVSNYHNYRIYNGQRYCDKRMLSLQMAKKVCEDWADLLYNEKVLITVGDAQANDNLHKAFEQLNADVIINNGIERAFALGTVAWVLTVSNSGQIYLENIDARQIYPITVVNGRVMECAFIGRQIIGQDNYAYISIHQKSKVTGNYVIENALYKLTDGSGLTLVSGEPEVYWQYDTGNNIPWFTVFSPNCVNNFDMGSPFGVSVFSNAIDELKAIDNAYDALNNEITNGRLRIMVGTEGLSYDKGREMDVFDPRDTVFHKVPKGINEDSFIQTIAPTLRSESIIESLNNSLAMFSQKCGMGAQYYIYNKITGNTAKTATEVISDNSPMFRRIRKHENKLKECLITFVTAVADIFTRKFDMPINIEQIRIHFDDSIIQDSESERKQDQTDVDNGIMSKVEYRMKWYGEDEATAAKAIEAAESTPTAP